MTELNRLPGDVIVVQYVRPDGRKRVGTISIGLSDEAINLAEEANKKLVCSMEVFPAGDVAVYVHRVGEPEELGHIGIADNGPGPQGIQNVLRNLIHLTLKDSKGKAKPLKPRRGRPNKRFNKGGIKT